MKIYERKGVEIVKSLFFELLIVAKTRFGIFFSYFCCGLKQSSDFNAKDITLRNKSSTMTNMNIFPKN